MLDGTEKRSTKAIDSVRALQRPRALQIQDVLKVCYRIWVVSKESGQHSDKVVIRHHAHVKPMTLKYKCAKRSRTFGPSADTPDDIVYLFGERHSHLGVEVDLLACLNPG